MSTSPSVPADIIVAAKTYRAICAVLDAIKSICVLRDEYRIYGETLTAWRQAHLRPGTTVTILRDGQLTTATVIEGITDLTDVPVVLPDGTKHVVELIHLATP